MLRFGPAGATHRVVFGHGVGGVHASGDWIESVIENWSKDERLSHIEFLVPTAPNREVTMLEGKVVPAWFNLEKSSSSTSGWEINMSHLEDSKRTYLELATCDGGNLQTTVFAGFSNGGATALFTGVQTECAGVMSMSSVIVGTEKLASEDLQRATPVLLCFGAADKFVPEADAVACQRFIETETACHVERHMFDDLEHTYSESKAASLAISVCADWLARVLKK